MKKMILIVCNGNMQRSVIAEQCIDKALHQSGLDGKYTAVSRGIQGTCGTKSPEHKNLRKYPLEWSLTQPVLEEIGVTIPVDQVATQIDERIVEEANLILVMEKGVFLERPNSLVRQFPLSGFKMRMFCELDGKADDIADLYKQEDPAVVRREILRIDAVVKERITQVIALTEMLTIQKG